MKTRLVRGFGINDADYSVQPNIGGVRSMCPFYSRWKEVLKRCYSKKSQSNPKNRNYAGCEVCEEWKYFSKFKLWMENQDWQEKQLDKDLIGNGRIYSPETCVFVSQRIN